MDLVSEYAENRKTEIRALKEIFGTDCFQRKVNSLRYEDIGSIDLVRKGELKKCLRACVEGREKLHHTYFHKVVKDKGVEEYMPKILRNILTSLERGEQGASTKNEYMQQTLPAPGENNKEMTVMECYVQDEIGIINSLNDKISALWVSHEQKIIHLSTAATLTNVLFNRISLVILNGRDTEPAWIGVHGSVKSVFYLANDFWDGIVKSLDESYEQCYMSMTVLYMEDDRSGHRSPLTECVGNLVPDRSHLPSIKGVTLIGLLAMKIFNDCKMKSNTAEDSYRAISDGIEKLRKLADKVETLGKIADVMQGTAIVAKVEKYSLMLGEMQEWATSAKSIGDFLTLGQIASWIDARYLEMVQQHILQGYHFRTFAYMCQRISLDKGESLDVRLEKTFNSARISPCLWKDGIPKNTEACDRGFEDWCTPTSMAGDMLSSESLISQLMKAQYVETKPITMSLSGKSLEECLESDREVPDSLHLESSLFEVVQTIMGTKFKSTERYERKIWITWHLMRNVMSKGMEKEIELRDAFLQKWRPDAGIFHSEELSG